MAEASSTPDDMKMELMEMGDTVIRIDIEQGDDMQEDNDPFGGRGGMGMGLSFEDATPNGSSGRSDENILVTSSRSQMQRMLDVLAGDEVEGGLGDSIPGRGSAISETPVCEWSY